jgi:hypothetical protein
MPDAIPMREIDSRDALRALGISAVVVNHAVAASLHGGLNLLLLISGISFARLCFGGRGDVRLISASLRFLRPLVTWSLVLCLLWFAAVRPGRGGRDLHPLQQLDHDRARLEIPDLVHAGVCCRCWSGLVLLLLLPGMRDGVYGQTPRSVRRHSGWAPPRSIAVALAGSGRHRPSGRQAAAPARLELPARLGASGRSSMRDRRRAGGSRSP